MEWNNIIIMCHQNPSLDFSVWCVSHQNSSLDFSVWCVFHQNPSLDFLVWCVSHQNPSLDFQIIHLHIHFKNYNTMYITTTGWCKRFLSLCIEHMVRRCADAWITLLLLIIIRRGIDSDNVYALNSRAVLSSISIRFISSSFLIHWIIRHWDLVQWYTIIHTSCVRSYTSYIIHHRCQLIYDTIPH